VAELTSSILEFVRPHPNWATAIVFILALGESLPFASLVLPFWALLVAIGTIIGAAAPFTFWSIVSAAAVGAALGDWLSYWIGYRYQNRLQGLWPIRNQPDLLQKARSFFKRWGAAAIVLARFSGPLRATLPIVAGMAGMPGMRFQLANWSSAFLWALVLLSPGALGLGKLLSWLK